MKIRMKVVMSGTRNGEAWPLPGGEVEVPDDEGANMCANGLAAPVRSDEDDVEKRAPAKKDDAPAGKRAKQTEKRG
jgi:hypothetical protein